MAVRAGSPNGRATATAAPGRRVGRSCADRVRPASRGTPWQPASRPETRLRELRRPAARRVPRRGGLRWPRPGSARVPARWRRDYDRERPHSSARAGSCPRRRAGRPGPPAAQPSPPPRRPPVIGCRAAGPPSRPRVWVPTQVRRRAGAGHRAGEGAFVRGSGKASAGVRHSRALARGCVEAVLEGPAGRAPGSPARRCPSAEDVEAAHGCSRWCPSARARGGHGTQARAPRPGPSARQETNASPRAKARLRRAVAGKGASASMRLAREGPRAAVRCFARARCSARCSGFGRCTPVAPFAAPCALADDREVPLTRA